ncbi:tail protein [Lactococcus phage PLgW-1]|uniref:Distal tail protein n=3 Tax=Uwajimavirus PLgW1 TaxID=2845441 RepID=A0A2Z2P622_9CAUD|nr:tail protein [Lactococcus phage PLgW-1]ARQ94830.1 distal tail protein [Lactococcus phage PLgW-1]ASJ80002.1 distal tail protein [Lactococcus phage PLgY-16]ASJ80057.1 distal tail protein [Lactococcus phage PLgY-30]
MVRQYKIHTDMDNPIHNKTWDVTNGKLRFYEPTNLGIEVANNLWGSGGIGVLGARSINQPQMEFKLETFGTTLQENYTLMNEFVNDLLSVKYVTLEYQTEWFQVYADIALNEVTKTEGYGQNGTFSEKIVFDIVTKWYTFENLEFKTIANGEIIDGVSKIYGGKAGKTGYRYIKNRAYTYYGETHIERLARWDIKEPFFSFVAKLTPSPEVTAPNQDYGLQFLDVNGNEYSAIVFNFENRPDLITINTDVNDEWHQAITGDTTINAFPALSFSRYRTRIFQNGQMTMKNLSSVEIKVKRKVDFV